MLLRKYTHGTALYLLEKKSKYQLIHTAQTLLFKCQLYFFLYSLTFYFLVPSKKNNSFCHYFPVFFLKLVGRGGATKRFKLWTSISSFS